jgi:hypothetical protein
VQQQVASRDAARDHAKCATTFGLLVRVRARCFTEMKPGDALGLVDGNAYGLLSHSPLSSRLPSLSPPAPPSGMYSPSLLDKDESFPLLVYSPLPRLRPTTHLRSPALDRIALAEGGEWKSVAITQSLAAILDRRSHSAHLLPYIRLIIVVSV